MDISRLTALQKRIRFWEESMRLLTQDTNLSERFSVSLTELKTLVQKVARNSQDNNTSDYKRLLALESVLEQLNEEARLRVSFNQEA